MASDNERNGQMDTQSWKEMARCFDFQGHQIAYWTGGNEKAKPLLLVHGFLVPEIGRAHV